MASIITQSISHVASQAVQTPRAAGVAGESQAGQNSPDVAARVSQVTAARAAEKVREDKERGVATPKKTEAGFSPEEEKDREEREAKESESESEQGPAKKSLYVVA